MTSHALLLTDVVDSTKLSEDLGDARMAALWAAHDRVARDLLVVHGGREIDKTDGFLLLFEDPEPAAAYAVAYHRAIAALDPPVKARAGLHVGPVILTRNAEADVARGAKPLEVDGIAKPIAARVMSVAQGGQTLSTVRVGPRVESHGFWRMKGLSEPIELFELGEEGALFRPPPDGAKVYRVVQRDGAWLPAREVPNALPAERDVFVGRARDLDALAHLLEESRLVSVLGMAGTGKTRLVTRFAWTWLGDFPGGAWFCDLSEARGVDGIAQAVARALDISLAANPIDQLGRAIAGRGPCLVVLDNFEQVASFAPETVGRWLDRAPEARFVVTTREILGLPGEAALALAPLGPDEAVGLFVTRAKAANRDFTLTDADRPAVEALARLLDGLPLAIELAAARARVMPPKVLLQRMSERFKLLASAGGRHTRQSTLRGALDWSWDLLSADERSALAQLSVFEGGLTLEAAEAVLALDDLWPMDAVQALVDKSLVRRAEHERFDLLVSVQEYAAEKLDASGGRAAAEARHGAWFGSVANPERAKELWLRGGTEKRHALRRELDNLVIAARRAVARGDAEVAEFTASGAWNVLELIGPVRAGWPLLTAARGIVTEVAAIGRIELPLGWAAAAAGRPPEETKAHFEAALAARRALGAGESTGLMHLGQFAATLGRVTEARASLEEALVLARAEDNALIAAQILTILAITYALGPDLDEGRRRHDEALVAIREIGDRRNEGSLLGNLGFLCAHHGRFDEAARHVEGALAIAREVGNKRSEATALYQLGALARRRGHLDEARRLFEGSLALAREVADDRTQLSRRIDLGLLLQADGRPEEAREQLRAALALASELGARPFQGSCIGHLAAVDADLGRTREARDGFTSALELHRAIGNGPGQAFCLAGLARLASEAGTDDWAALADEAVTAGAGLAVTREIALRARAELRLAHGDVAGARADLDALRALVVQEPALLEATEARALLAEGRPEAAAAALALATELAGPARRESKVGRALDQVRALLGAA